MSKEVTVAELRENLDEIIAQVEAGETVTIVHTRSARKQPPRYPFRGLKITPLKKPLDIDVVELIRQDRDNEYPR